MIRLAWRNVGRSLEQHRPVALYFGAVLAIVVWAQGLLSGADAQLKAVYPGALTGDLVVAPRSDSLWTLFGQEDSLWGDGALPPTFSQSEGLEALTASVPGVASVAGVVAGPAVADQEGRHVPVWVFGVDPAPYGRTLPDLEAGFAQETGAWLSEPLAADLKNPKTLRLLQGSGGDFQIVAPVVRGTLHYRAPVKAVENIVVVDAPAARHLLGLDAGPAPTVLADETSLIGRSDADLFGGAADQTAVPEAPTTLVGRAPATGPAAQNWNFLLVRADPTADLAALKVRLAEAFAEKGWDLRLMEWREAGGASALYLVWLQAILAFGLVLLALVGAGSLFNSMNSIVVERTVEVGTLRALGASRGWVSGLFLAEALLVVAAACLVGVALAWAGQTAVNLLHLRVANPIWALVLGDSRVVLGIDPALVAADLAAVAVLALVGTLWPLGRVLGGQVRDALEQVPE